MATHTYTIVHANTDFLNLNEIGTTFEQPHFFMKLCCQKQRVNKE